MRTNGPSRWFNANLLVLLAVCAVGLGLSAAPSYVTDTVRLSVRDSIVPGWKLIRTVTRRARQLVPSISTADRSKEVTALSSDLAEWKQTTRQLQIRNALLHEQLEQVRREGAAPYRATAGKPLLIPELLSASILGGRRSALWRSGVLIDLGRRGGVAESSLVLEDGRPLIDQGRDAGIVAEQPVYAGRCVIGRVAHVGRFSSTLLPVTDRSYRAGAQIIRRTEQGYRFRTKGVLEGTGGAHCRLKFIDATEPISVGDDVYTADRDGTLPYPLYYGKVVRADLPPGALKWVIDVQPAADLSKQTAVQILRIRVNPLRVAKQ